MIFLNPWAWLGLIAIAGPLVAHLLARRPARREPFPHLRFLPATSLKPVRRDRLTDATLLTVRMATIAAAVVALAQPLWLTPARTRQRGDRIARAIVIDTSASMDRAAIGGGPAIDAARGLAEDEAGSATVARQGESRTPASLVAGAVVWLQTQPMRRELVIVSDFQPTAIGRADLDPVPADVGIRLIPIDVDPAAALPPAGGRGNVRLLAGASERAAADAAREAAVSTGAPATGRADRPTAIVFPEFETRATLLGSAQPLNSPWMFDVVGLVTSDPLLQAAAARQRRAAADVIEGSRAAIDGRDYLLIVLDARADSLIAAATLRATLKAVADEPPPAEADAAATSAAELRAWSRPPAAVQPSSGPAGTDESDAHWWWIGALALLGIETLIRGRPARTRVEVEEVPRARVA